MLTYNDLYELLRKEKYSEQLQPLSEKFIQEFSEYINERTSQTEPNNPFSADSKSKKQLENALSIFKELILRRKKKILNLVFVATETGIMKRDYENMLPTEKKIFDSLTKIFENADKTLSKMLNGNTESKSINKLIVFKEDIDSFINHQGKTIGPFKSGNFANLNNEIADILISSEKAEQVNKD